MNFKRVIILLITVFLIKTSCGSHIRAGEIITQRISTASLEYKITLNLYMDASTYGQGNASFDNAEISCSDGWLSGEIPFTSNNNIGNNTVKLVFELLSCDVFSSLVYSFVYELFEFIVDLYRP